MKIKKLIKPIKLTAVLCLTLAALFVGQEVKGQIKVPFTQRTSTYSPEKKIYNIKGDFEMIGNTNLTLQNYTQEGNNSSNMVYVDIDGDPNTLNSSSATLSFSNENGAIEDCSNIIYAGLYWTGRADNGGTGQMEFDITTNRTNGNVFSGYTLSITSADDNSDNTSNDNRRITTYTFTPTSGGDAVVFRYYTWRTGNWWGNYTYYNKVTVQTGSGAVNEIYNSNGNVSTVSFSAQNTQTIGTGANQFKITSLSKDGRTTNTINDSFYAVSAHNLNKRKVKLKKAGDTYQTITAAESDIYYPMTNDGQMYSAYAEVTDYVKANGIGEYFVADMALREGTGGGTGFYGGWGMIVVYENSKMKWRDVTIFDGHAYINDEKGGANNEAQMTYYDLPISGFNSAQNGDIRIKYGLIAGEGDRELNVSSGTALDRFAIKNRNNEWVNLSHPFNSVNNFFNSSIYTGGNARTPNLVNNTGIDLVMDLIPNTNNSIIGNSQTSTTFRYGTNQDTYIISCIAFAVDAYIPEVESVNGIEEINGVAVGNNFDYTVQPGDEVTFKLDVKNKGSEAVKDLKLNIPVPFSGSYINASATYNSAYYGQAQNSIQPVHDGGFPGNIVWEIGDLPQPTNPDDVLASITFTVKISTDCAILTNINCNTFTLTGTTTGVGVTSGTNFTLDRFVTGYESEGVCVGEPDYTPISLTIDAEEWTRENCNLDPDYYKRSFEFCDINEIPLTGIDGIRLQFPQGTRFYSGIEFYILNQLNEEEVIPKEDVGNYGTVYVRKAATAAEYNSSNPFPLAIGQGPKTYFAIAPGLFTTCYWEFTIDVVQYCGNFWMGEIDTDWGKVGNWTAQTVPASGEDVEFATVANNKNKPAKKDLHLDQDRTIGNLINNSSKNLVVTTGNQLEINGIVEDNYASAGTIIVESKADQPTGTLIFTNTTDNANVDATVQFYNKAYTCDNCGDIDRQKWQYFGVPVKSIGSMPFPTGITGTINKWSEPAFGNKWITPGSPLTAFTGYEINDAANATPTAIYNFAGKLNVGNASIGITKTISVNYSGRNLIGNSYTAAIPIANGFTFNGTWDNTVYLFNAGSRNEWRKLTGATVNGIEGGRYLSVPTNTAGTGGLPSQIPSMHTFMIDATVGGNLSIDYSKLTKNALVGTGMAWRSASTQPTAMPYIVMEIIGSQSADKVWMFENITTTRSLDAGWDGVKMPESGLVQLYVSGEDDYKFQVATVPQLQGTTLGIKPDNNENMSISFAVSSEIEARNLYLRDLLTGRAYPIRNLSEYSVSGVSTEIAQRFRVVSIADDQMSKQSVGNEIIEVFAMDNQIGIANNSDENCVATVYDVTGKALNKVAVNKGSTQFVGGADRTTTGIYVVKVVGGSISETKRVMMK